MSKHAPATWGMSKVGNHYDDYMIYPEGGKNIITCIRGKANAKLVVKSPDMLKALKAIISGMPEESIDTHVRNLLDRAERIVYEIEEE